MSGSRKRFRRLFRNHPQQQDFQAPDIPIQTHQEEGVEVPAGMESLTAVEVAAILNKLANNKGSHNFVCLAKRPGVAEWAQDLEYLHYPPGTPYNDNIQVVIIEWKSLPWLIVSIPAKDHHLAVAAAKRTNMKVVDGVPLMIQGQGKGKELKKTFFPLHSENTYTIENDPCSGSHGKQISIENLPPSSDIFHIVSDPSRQ